MALKNYYLILGVERAESERGIRSAFRELARRYHPDRAGPGSTRAFQEIQEAYQVLSDPDARRSYDRRYTRRADTDRPPGPRSARPAARQPAEPLVPGTMSLARDFRLRPSREAVLDRFQRNFTQVSRPKAEHSLGMTVEVVLTPQQAQTGGFVTLGVPAFATCPSCAGTGRVWLYRCEYCWGEGVVENERPVRVRIPPLVPDGAVIEIPLGGFGIHNFHLRILVRVGDPG